MTAPYGGKPDCDLRHWLSGREQGRPSDTMPVITRRRSFRQLASRQGGIVIANLLICEYPRRNCLAVSAAPAQRKRRARISPDHFTAGYGHIGICH